MMEAVDDLEDEPIYMDLMVQNPRCEPEMYVSYEIIIETNSPCFSSAKSVTRRRYSEFAIVHKLISKEFPAIKTPALPPKFPFRDHFNGAFVENRRKSLEEFLQKLISNKIYLSSKALHLFLQSYLSMNDIKDITRGKFLNGMHPKVEYLNDRTYKDLISSSSSDYGDMNSNQHNSVENVYNEALADSDSSVLTESSVACDTNSPASNKRVSFCNQVTVAQIHVD